MRLVNGVAAEQLSLADRALQFGDGVFRTLVVRDGAIEFWQRHVAKLAHDCARLGITAPAASVLLDDIRRLAPVNAVIKIIVTRGESVRGYAVPVGCQPNRIVQMAPLPPRSDAPLNVRWCSTRASWQPALAGIKHLNRLENVLARAEWNDPDIHEGLLLDRDGYVVEGVMSNLVLYLDGTFVTPKLNEAGVAGVMRDVVRDAATQAGDVWRERRIGRAEIYAAQAVWLCNSVMGLRCIARCDALPLSMQWPLALRERLADMHCAERLLLV
ncbi:aminodeoxychorismate lyase [Chitinibacteraceae bacterium HSL-7]